MSDWNTAESFQDRVSPWMIICFGLEIAADRLERCDRFIEEALELVQAMEYPPERAHALVDYVFNRPMGQPAQEVGGVMVTLAALCLAANLDMHEAGETELARIWTKVEQIRAKQAAKPRGSALPTTSPTPDNELVEAAKECAIWLALASWESNRPKPSIDKAIERLRLAISNHQGKQP